ncbi:MAG: hypothetical protein ACRBBV_11170 [Paracoccaceae bacterium]
MTYTNAHAVSCSRALQILPLDGVKCDSSAPFIRFAALRARVLHRFNPVLVLSWLYARDHDAVDVATKLAEAGYQGRYQVITRALPRPGIVKRELQAICPDVQVELVQRPTNDKPLHGYDDYIANPDPEMGQTNMPGLQLLA